KRTAVDEYPMHHRAGQGVFTLKVTDRVGKLAAMRVNSDPEEEVLIISASGMVLRTQVGAISRIGRQTQGVIVMRLAPDDQVVAIAPVGALEEGDAKEQPRSTWRCSGRSASGCSWRPGCGSCASSC